MDVVQSVDDEVITSKANPNDMAEPMLKQNRSRCCPWQVTAM